MHLILAVMQINSRMYSNNTMVPMPRSIRITASKNRIDEAPIIKYRISETEAEECKAGW